MKVLQMFSWKTESKAKLGPLTQRVLKRARWQEAFPCSQEIADEFEDALKFLEQEKQFERFLAKLRPSDLARDSALAEIFVAYYLSHYKHFSIMSWEPEGVHDPHKESPYLGEFEISKTGGPPIFVEVKGPNWRAELSDAERANNRDKLPKSVLGQGGSFRAEEEVLRIARHAMYKFRSDCPNLLIVVSDLKVSPFRTPEAALKYRISSFLGKPESTPLGGLLLFDWAERPNDRQKKYHT